MLSKEFVAASTSALVLSILAERKVAGSWFDPARAELSQGKIEWTEGIVCAVFIDEGINEWEVARVGDKADESIMGCKKKRTRRSADRRNKSG